MKHSKSKGAKTFILVKEETLDSIEGCLIFEMKNNQYLLKINNTNNHPKPDGYFI